MALGIRKERVVILFFICAVVLQIHPATCNISSGEEDPEIEMKSNQKDQKVGVKNEIKDEMQIRRERRIATRMSWRRTFDEIRALTVKPSSLSKSLNVTNDKTNAHNSSLISNSASTVKATKKQKSSQSMLANWKMKPSSQQTRRFDGFADWERQLQRWTERASDYFQYEHSKITNKRQQKHSHTQTNVQNELKEKQRINKDSDVKRKNNNPLTFPVALQPKPAKPDEPILPHTNIADKSKHIWIVTTAALPWMTGTAINPILRAAYLLKGRPEAGGSVTLMVPWLDTQEEHIKVYGQTNANFTTQQSQEDFIRHWLKNVANMPEAAKMLNIQWYPAWHNALENSVYSKGDITALIPEDQVDICVLEEPEHLNWYREAGESWTMKFKHVVGIVHTNYFVYAQEQPASFIRAPGMRLLCSWMIRAHCHRVIKLSGTLGTFAPEKELIENVHGVRESFLDAGERVRQLLLSNSGKNHPIFGSDATPTVYFLGKMLWSKGILSLMELLKYAEESADLRVKVDMYGGGPDKDQAVLKSIRFGLDMPFHGPIDHAALADTHKIFINPSVSEVLCTAVAEALAMGKFVVLPSHPSNDFFAQFPNCLPYATKEEFVGNLYYAMTHSPEPLTEEYSFALSWEAATERFEAAGSISVAEAHAYDQAVNASMADSEINLPPIIEDQGRRRKLTAGLRLTRSRFRQFRSKLSEEIQESHVFPKAIEQKIVHELDKRLDLDLDEVLNSPKLRLKLSPAELDAQLLDLYNSLSQGPGGDAIRSILGGEYVSKQSLKSKNVGKTIQNSSGHSKRKENLEISESPDSESFDDFNEDKDLVPEKLVQKTLKRNFPSIYDKFNGNSNDLDGSYTENIIKGGTKMSLNLLRQRSQSRSRLNAQQWGTVVQWRCLSNNMIIRPIPTNLKMKCR